VAALVSAVLFGVAFPPFPLIVPVFLCLVPFAAAIARRADESESWQSAARIGFWFGLVGYGINLYWIAIALLIYTKLAVLGYFGALLVLTPVVTLTAVALFVARRATRWPMVILLPVVWVSSELLLNHLSDLAFPWLPLGLATAHLPRLAQLADLSGVRGVSFWIAAISGLLADAWLLRASRAAVIKRAVAVIVLLAAAVIYGGWRLSSITLRPVAPIAIVQPNIPQEEKWQAENQGRILGILADLTRERLARHDARLVLWPEAALPGFLLNHPGWSATLRQLAASSHTPILFGVLDITFPNPNDSSDYDYYNAAMLVDSLGRLGTQPTYRKSYLVPVVERVPFLNPRWFRSLKYFGGYGRGGHPEPLTLPFGKVGVLICYESIFPERSRTYRREGASVLVNITNDAWFGRSIAPYQHEAHLVFRAIENRVGIVRAANTGISGYIDPLGRIHGATQLFVPATRTYEAQTTDARTLYVLLGDWIGIVSAVVVVGALLVAAARRHQP
jgi:apolipoprotein N-acyltransferase